VILAIETSCDDTCAALVSRDGEVRSNVIASQGLLHARYGGVVPEIASRHHLELVDAVTADALERAGARLDDVETVAVTRGPGLIGALLVGLSSAKALAAARRLPLVPVDHLHGHVTAGTLGRDPIEPPYLCLVASGGHTFLARVDDPARYSVLGQTLDDAAGEAFDKGARLLGLGYPGGPAIDSLAREGDPVAFDFPRSAPGELDFSFSGLKTALLYKIRELGDGERGRRGKDGGEEARRRGDRAGEEARPRGEQPRRGDLGGEARRRSADLAASYQRAIVDALVSRTAAALERERLERLAIGGGVAANSELRAAVRDLGVPVWVPPIELCTDNAAMIAGAARFLEPIEYPGYLDLDASADLARAGEGVGARRRPGLASRRRDTT
jgi:N6-L-threonylcarbamoyladenine synthase